MSAAYMPPRPRPRTVLVVDGDPQWLAAACRAVGSEYPVLAATCGADAVRTAENVKHDRILLDVMNPGGTEGRQGRAEWRSDPGTRDMPVSVVSAMGTATGLRVGMASRMDRLWKSVHTFIERSASWECLMDALHNAIGPSFCHRSRIGISSAVNQTHRMSY